MCHTRSRILNIEFNKLYSSSDGMNEKNRFIICNMGLQTLQCTEEYEKKWKLSLTRKSSITKPREVKMGK